MTVRISAGWKGENFGDWVSGVGASEAIAVQAGVSTAGQQLRDELRNQVADAALGERLGNAIGLKVYPAAAQGSLDAAAYVYPRGRKANAIFDSFNSASVIQAKNGRYLAIPTREAGRGFRRSRATPDEFEKRTGIKLQFVQFRNGKAALAGTETATRYARGVKKGRNRVIYFFLVPVARMPHRLNFDATAQGWADRIPDLIEAAGKAEGL